MTPNQSILRGIWLCIVCGLLVRCAGCAAHAADYFICSFNASTSETNTVAGQYGLYKYAATNDSPVYAGAFCIQGQTNIIFDAATLPNPCYLTLRFEEGTNASPFTDGILFSTNSFVLPKKLTAPSGMNFRRK